MKVLITGAGGFVGKNLQQHLAECKDIEVVCFTRANTTAELPHVLKDVA
ncbi:MAG TPA: sugar nucleotide-binding protein, partial [Burkholderiaceae bacterium]|nr:sugar nucleotide-binding protein [Burkholderiaceae bacterium]